MTLLDRRSNNAIWNELWAEEGLEQDKVVEDDGTYFYICKAKSGTATSVAHWKIKRITQATGNARWADDNSKYDNVQSNWATLDYGS